MSFLVPLNNLFTLYNHKKEGKLGCSFLSSTGSRYFSILSACFISLLCTDISSKTSTGDVLFVWLTVGAYDSFVVGRGDIDGVVLLSSSLVWSKGRSFRVSRYLTNGDLSSLVVFSVICCATGDRCVSSSCDHFAFRIFTWSCLKVVSFYHILESLCGPIWYHFLIGD